MQVTPINTAWSPVMREPHYGPGRELVSPIKRRHEGCP